MIDYEIDAFFPQISCFYRRGVCRLSVFRWNSQRKNPGISPCLPCESGEYCPGPPWALCIRSPGASPENFPIDPFLLAARISKDAILAYHTALEAHGKAYSVYEHFTYLVSKPIPLITFRSHLFKGVRFPQALLRKKVESFDVMKADRSGMEIRITGLERTFVDVLNRPDLSGSWEEIWRSLETVEYFDLDKVTEYTLLLENATTAAKVGFFLDQHRESLMVEDVHLKAIP